MAEPKPLSARQEAFCREYLVDLNTVQAALRAGYSEKYANHKAHTLLRNPAVAAEIERRMAARSRRTEVSADQVLEGLAAIAFGDLRRLFDEKGALLKPDEMPDDVAACLAGLDVVTVSKGQGAVEYVAKVKTNDRLRALELIGKHLGMFIDRQEVTLKGTLAARILEARKRVDG